MQAGEISDDTRIKAVLPTIQYLTNEGAKAILITHFGRPKCKAVEELRVDPIATHLAKLLNKTEHKTNEVYGNKFDESLNTMETGDVLLLENARFEPGEEKNDPELAKQLGHLADIFVNDAFGTSHRAHASTTGVADYIPAVAGFLMNKEIQIMGKALEQPERP